MKDKVELVHYCNAFNNHIVTQDKEPAAEVAVAVDEEWAERICRAVNCHDELVKALKKAREYVACYGKTTDAMDDRDMIDDALTKAKGGAS